MSTKTQPAAHRSPDKPGYQNRLCVLGPPPSDIVYPRDGSNAYLLAEGQMYGNAILLAIIDAGRVWPSRGPGRFATIRATVDAIRFLFDPNDRRRYYLAAAAGIDADSLDAITDGLKHKHVAPPRMSNGVTAEGIARLRERLEYFSRRPPQRLSNIVNAGHVTTLQ